MKTMTCKQMGGPCDMPIRGNTAQEMMDNGAKHVKEMNDEGHKNVLKMMDDMQKNPEANKKWNGEFKAKFDALPED